MATTNELPLEIDCRSVKGLLEEKASFIFVDCREPKEYALVRIEEAQLLPMSEIQQRIGELQPHRDEQIVIHCHHGGRSLQVAQWLRGQGYEKAQSMAGGIDAWAETVDPSLPRY